MNNLMQNQFYRGRFSVAPMLDWTTRHCRYFHRQFSRHALLYTEMITAPAIIHAKYDLLEYDPSENPVALQLGGSDPAQLANCAKLVEERGYAEINLNVGCPSDRVQNGMFGACLMAKADLVADCIKAMQDAVQIPVTVKHRIGIDDLDSYEFLCDFIEKVQPYSNDFIVHARKAWLSGLSPKQNREIPPLDYERVYQLKRDFPHLNISINGGIKTIEEIKRHLAFVDGVMVGREAYQNPSLLGEIDSQIFGENRPLVTAREAVEKMLPYIAVQTQKGVYLNHIVRHMLGAFQNCKGARQWRRHLSENATKQGAGVEVVEQALSFVQESN
ncbi:tRNA dihydrouridine(20/20a) synthase DusA [Actinobacillus pleuropneumoniae]|uniref:tRNA-dihydrouridine(20/20a) synthase n=3 Tax=Actinobacillus pleuropneumoniae TaxID=715 RepID=A0A9Q4DFB4_ACTPL|nr:tRNA dihydrouridine(20/20a) synthase DusA [Actinobacillus pleuropneumoniae]EFM88531.1 tRNA-dihydrouridine synthase A [Actinobacillus pleuropneumoniae serovar 2 str. S1536]EFM92879.1 tRNA-dihydrouridine synthase A [Actinobacillus pleuropneumoniae serovar 6 str. Femo]MCL7720692.1 tRNA dihydrouridine(20/20a) synthase DusA [Actinobacillus pleuropneumoniae]MCL7727011.1 tRNA dihydrouridine(20/20a) synthase DusA [Actinobacillus pleuropneumoniae]MCL7730113.1 tRNA dihydrouridine(20/20a) synthase Dus